MVTANRRLSMHMYNLDPNPKLHLLSSMLGLPILNGDVGHFPVVLWKMYLSIVFTDVELI